jgi:hypothetical protein
VWLEINHVETLVGHMDWEGEIREIKCSSIFVKGMDLSLSTHGLRTLREGLDFSALRSSGILRGLGLLTREDGTDTLSRNVGKQLPHDAA